MIRRIILVCIAGLIAMIGIAGCTAHERRGYSALPQNRPADWESRSFGPLRN